MSYPYAPDDSPYRAPAAPAPAYPANAFPPAPSQAAPPISAPPTSPPPTYQQPTSAPPTQAFPTQPSYAPGTAAAETQTPPASAPPYGPPPSQYGQTPQYGQAPPPAPKGRATLVLAILSVLLLMLGGVGFGLYLNERGDLRDTRSDLNTQLQEQRDIVTERDEKIAETEARVGELTTELDTTKENLSGVTEERDILLPCMRRAQEMFDAARAGNESKLDTALRQADTACSRAQAGVDS